MCGLSIYKAAVAVNDVLVPAVYSISWLRRQGVAGSVFRTSSISIMIHSSYVTLKHDR